MAVTRRRRVPPGPAKDGSGSDVDSRVFRSVDEFVAFLRAQKASPGKNYIGKWIGDQGSARDWNGNTESVDAMLATVRDGWKEGADKIAKLRAAADPIVSAVKAKVESVVYDVTGAWLDIGKFVGGDPEPFGSVVMTDSSVSAKVVRLDCNLSASCGVTAERLYSRGAAACAFADIVESSGARCEIWAIDGVRTGMPSGDAKKIMQTRILVKAAHEPLDMARVAAVLAHPGFLRRLVFDYHSATGYDDGMSYPNPYLYDKLPSGQREFDKEPGVVVFPELHFDLAGSKDGFRNIMLACLRDAGLSVDGLAGIEMD